MTYRVEVNLAEPIQTRPPEPTAGDVAEALIAAGQDLVTQVSGIVEREVADELVLAARRWQAVASTTPTP